MRSVSGVAGDDGKDGMGWDRRWDGWLPVARLGL